MSSNQELTIEQLLKDFAIEQSDFESFFNFYNNDFKEYGNEIYNDFKVRLVHLKYFLENSWWNNRFHFLWKYYKNYEQVIDLGFSVPYLPIHLYKLGKLNELPKMLYVDGNETSKKLADNILGKLNIRAKFVTGDLLDKSTWKSIDSDLTNDSKLFCLFETIEHLNDPTEFWGHIGKYNGSDMTLSLPIGFKIPSHNHSFQNEKEAINYIQQYLELKESKVFDGKVNGSEYRIFTALGSII